MSPRANDHPLRLARLRRGVSVAALASSAEVNRTTLDAIEEGRTRKPASDTLQAIERALDLPEGFLAPRIAAWHTQQAGSQARLSMKARATLGLRPNQLQQYSSFQAWRREIAASPTAFASLVGVPRATVAEYERGSRDGFPQTLASAIIRAFDVSDEYLMALEVLEPNDELAARRRWA